VGFQRAERLNKDQGIPITLRALGAFAREGPISVNVDCPASC
jgi:hypothetical protein